MNNRLGTWMPWNMDIFAIGGSEERGYVMYDVEFDDIYIYMKLCFISIFIDDD